MKTTDRIWLRVVLVAMLFGLTVGPSAAIGLDATPAGFVDARQGPVGAWQTTGLADHLLVGQIWDVRRRAFVSAKDPRAMVHFVKAMRAPFALLGEIHDNPDHHRLQAWLIRLRGVYAGAIVMEMIREDQRGALAEYLAREDATASGLGAALGWSQSGWPAWEFYEPIAEAAFESGLTILPGDPPKKRFRGVARKGLSLLGANERRLLRLDEDLERPAHDALLDELYDSHCRLMPRSALSGMLGAQRYRDAHLAQALVLGAAQEYEAGRAANATLIAGNGHTRKDRGVAWYLKRMQPSREIVSVWIVEVEAGVMRPGDYLQGRAQGAPSADFIIFTPRQTREDPCEAMRRKFGK